MNIIVMIKIMNDFLCEIQTGNVEEDKEETERKIGIIKWRNNFAYEREKEGGGVRTPTTMQS